MLGGCHGVVLAAFCLLLSGCTVGADPPTAHDTVLVIEDPNDFSYLNETNASKRPHVHDYWGGQTTKTVAEGELRTYMSNVAGTSSSWDNRPLAVPDGQMVIPGTRWVNITATWQNERPQFTVDFFIDYQTANASGGRIKVPSGQTVSIEVAEEMNDLAHAKRTRWSLKGHAQGSGNVWIADIKAQVKVEIARTGGDLPFAPAHHDTWGANTTRTLFHEAKPMSDTAGLRGATSASAPPVSPQILPVPIETTVLRLRFAYNSTTHTAFHYNPVLDYRPADRGTNSPAYAMKPTKREPKNVDGLIEWEIPVKAEMWDSPYASRSDWSFKVFWGGETGGSRSTTGANLMQGDYRLTATAERGPHSGGSAEKSSGNLPL